MRGVLGVEAVAGHHRVEDRAAAVGLGPQQPARAAAPPPGVTRRCPKPAPPQRLPAGRWRSWRPWTPPACGSRRGGTRRTALRVRRFLVDPWITGAFSSAPELVELVEVGADHQRRLVGMAAPGSTSPPRSWSAPSSTACSAPRARRWRRSSARCRSCVTRTSMHSAGRDPALRLDVLPRRVVALRADQARTRRPRGRPRGSASRSGRGAAGTADRRSSGTPARAAGAPRRR